MALDGLSLAAADEACELRLRADAAADGSAAVVAPQVVVGTVDICGGAGCRAAAALSPSGPATACHYPLVASGLWRSDAPPAEAPLGTLTTFFDGGRPVLSTVCLTVPPPASSAAAVAAALLALLAPLPVPAALAAAPLERLVLAAALRLTGEASAAAGPSGGPLAAAWGLPPSAAPAAAGLRLLPPSTKVADPLLAALLHFARVRALPAGLVTVAGYKPSAGDPSGAAAAVQAAAGALGAAMGGWLGARFDAGAMGAVAVQAASAWPGAREEPERGTMYL